MKNNKFKKCFLNFLVFSLFFVICCAEIKDSSNPLSGIADPSATEGDSSALSFVLNGTHQESCYDNTAIMDCPDPAGAFYGQDGQYQNHSPRFTDNGDGTITDNNTGLTWQQDPGKKIYYADAVSGADDFSLAAYDDWRLPTLKELYSLIDFLGEDPSGYEGSDTSGLVPFIDTNYFVFEYGDTDSGERIIDAQFASSTEYVSTTMHGNPTVFGVNFADGRIKGYEQDKTFFVLHVRGMNYGENDFIDNGDKTITDQATGLMWMQIDSGDDSVMSQVDSFTNTDGTLNWEEALAFCENLDFADHDDWRLPNAKELQSIVDYSRSPATTDSAAIDPVFEATEITDENGWSNYAYYWTSTTHAKYNGFGDAAVYIAFGEAMGNMHGTWMDVHGAGAQRSDPKAGDPEDYPNGHGPQGDAIRIYNYARCTRDL